MEIKSNNNLANWRGAVTTYTESEPTDVYEYSDLNWEDFKDKIQSREQPLYRPGIRAEGACFLKFNVKDVDAIIEKLKTDDITFIADTNRIIIPLNRNVSLTEYTQASKGFNYACLGGQADANDFDLCYRHRTGLSNPKEVHGGVADADALIAIYKQRRIEELAIFKQRRVEELATLGEVEYYNSKRKAAQELEIELDELDSLVKAARKPQEQHPVTAPPVLAKVNELDNAKPLKPESFPDKPLPGKQFPPTTIANVEHLLNSYGFIVRYNVIKKKLEIRIPGYSGTPDNADSVAIAYIISLANLNGITIGQVPEFVETIGDKNLINPAADWITSKPWDGIDRLQALYDTLIPQEGYPEELKRVLIRKWLRSAVMAVLMVCGFKARGVLTLQGPQSMGKTTWFSALVPDLILREQLIKLDHHMDVANKDSILTAISHWIVEIGELDSSFKKDIARLKGFLTSDRDKIRKPYGRTNSEYQRRTVFCATVNDANFLVDTTGNTRWWTIPVTKVIYNHNIDMQQLFAQLAESDEAWWLTKDEEMLLESFNKNHRSVSSIHERILSVIDLNGTMIKSLTASGMLIELEIKNPTNTQCKECASVLRELFGQPKKINGAMKWRIPFSSPVQTYHAPEINEDDY